MPPVAAKPFSDPESDNHEYMLSYFSLRDATASFFLGMAAAVIHHHLPVKYMVQLLTMLIYLYQDRKARRFDRILQKIAGYEHANNGQETATALHFHRFVVSAAMCLPTGVAFTLGFVMVQDRVAPVEAASYHILFGEWDRLAFTLVSLGAAAYRSAVAMRNTPWPLHRHELRETRLRLSLETTIPNWISYRFNNLIWRQVRLLRQRRRRRRAMSVLDVTGCHNRPRYQYRPLASAKGEVRLLTLHASTNGEIHCDIIHDSIYAPSRAYEAVSYRWGNPETSHTLLIGDDDTATTLPIPESVHQVLTALCPTQGSRYLWVDWICIDQSRPQEKATQIPLMRSVFRKANRVIAYLGQPESQDAGFASAFMHRAVWQAQEYLDSLETWEGDFRDHFARHNHAIPFSGDQKGWRAFERLVGLDYWRRMWIIQEVTVARKLHLVYGEAHFPWTSLDLFDTYFPRWRSRMRQFQDTDRTRHDGESNFEGMFRLRREFRDSQAEPRWSLAQLLADLRCYEASDKRDKVNALVGISTSRFVPALMPAEERSVADTFVNAARVALLDGGYEILSIAGLTHPRNPELGLPSWVPDLTSPPRHASNHHYQRGYRAGGHPRPSPHRAAFPNKHHVELLGHRIGAVKALASEFPTVPEPPETAGDRVWRAADSLLTRFLGYSSEAKTLWEGHGKSREQDPLPIFRALVEDYDGDSYPAKDLPVLLREFTHLVEEGTKLLQAGHSTANLETSFAVRAGPHDEFRGLRYLHLATWALDLRLFSVTTGGAAAMVPKATKVGDLLCAIAGSPLPCVLRPVEDVDKFVLIGDAYVDGFMNGEAMAEGEEWFCVC
ncbi:hypothetical protein MFIFM68171_07649 [Madurella fahalii]|uniref:Heterokaryon incompatibility domain-containing protein n=1 Tax=Madurella fahalii TaxID=1157608 RepID=A0ABQ0GI56_9PEZI